MIRSSSSVASILSSCLSLAFISLSLVLLFCPMKILASSSPMFMEMNMMPAHAPCQTMDGTLISASPTSPELCLGTHLSALQAVRSWEYGTLVLSAVVLVMIVLPTWRVPFSYLNPQHFFLQKIRHYSTLPRPPILEQLMRWIARYEMRDPLLSV